MNEMYSFLGTHWQNLVQVEVENMKKKKAILEREIVKKNYKMSQKGSFTSNSVQVLKEQLLDIYTIKERR